METKRLTGSGKKLLPVSLPIVSIILLYLLAIFLASLTSRTSLTDQTNIYGAWSGQYKDYDLLFRFSNDSTCELNFSDKKLTSTLVLIGKFDIVLNKSPGALTIRNIQQLNYNLHTVVQFVNVDALKIAPFAPLRRLRPVTFHEAIYLTREAGERNRAHD